MFLQLLFKNQNTYKQCLNFVDDQYNIFRSAQKENMRRARNQNKSKLAQSRATHNIRNRAQNIQAPSIQEFNKPEITVEFGKEIIFYCYNIRKNGHDMFGWPWKDQVSYKNNQNIQSLPLETNSSDTTSKFERPSKILQKSENQDNSKMGDQRLYLQNESGLLKKQLEFQYKGLLSKSTDIDQTVGEAIHIRFRCKNHLSLGCPFLHILEYSRVIDGKIYYEHQQICSTHTSQCTLDDENIQYNVAMRKIDSSIEILEQIIKQDQTIKPKQILHIFAKKINQASEDFLYDGLYTKSIRRSIKKYFDNSVAKVKARIKQK